MVRLAGIKVVVFDLDDTLYSERSFAFSGFEAVGRMMRGLNAGPMDPAARMRELFDTAHRRRVFDQLLAELGHPNPAALIPPLIECYRTHTPAIRLYEDAESALARWSGHFRLALISDGPPETQRRKVKALGLEARLDPIVLTGQWGPEFAKPHRRAFEEIESVWGVSGRACVYLADNAAKDFIAPRQLDWRCVWAHRPAGLYFDNPAPPGGEPHAEVATLSEIELSS